MSTKTHLTKQEELIDENGIQIRSTDPATPVTNQVWINKTTDQIKYFDGTSTKVLGGSGTPPTTADDEKAWGGLERRLSEFEMNQRSASFNQIIDDFNVPELGVHVNTEKASSGLRLTGSFLTGTYTRTKKTATLAKKTSGIAQLYLQAIAPRAVAAAPSPTHTSPTFEYDGDLTGYFKVGSPIIVASFEISEGAPVYIPMLYNKNVALINIQSVSYDNVNNKTLVTYNNANAIDMSAGITNVADYPTKLMHIPFYDSIKVRANALDAFQVMQLREIHNSGVVCFPAANQQTIFNQAGMVGDIIDIDLKIVNNYGIIVASEVWNNGSQDLIRTHFWYSKDANALNPTWTKFSYVRSTLDYSPGGGAPENLDYAPTPYHFNYTSVTFAGERIALNANGKCIILATENNSSGFTVVTAFFTNLSAPSPTIGLLPQSGTNMSGISGVVRAGSANADNFNANVASDINGEYYIVTIARWNNPNPAVLIQYAYEWTGANPTSINAASLSNTNMYTGFTIITGSGTSQKIYTMAQIDSSGLWNLYRWTRSGTNLPFWDLTTIGSPNQPDWQKGAAYLEKGDYAYWLSHPWNSGSFDVGYFRKSTETVVHGTVGLIPVSTQISGNLAQYSAYANGGIMRENDYASINMNSIRNRSRRVFVHPSDPKRVIFLFSMPHRNTDRNAKTYALEVKDITSPVYNNALHNVTPNDRVFFRQSTTKQRLVQGVSSNGIPIATVFPLISRVGDFRRGQYKVRLRLLGAKVDNSPDENNIIATSIDEYDIADLPVRDTTNISGNFADYLPFSFLNKVTITSGQIFYIEVFTDAPISAINYLAWASNNGNTLSGVGSWYYNGTNWTQPAGSQEASNSNDLCFFLCGEFVRIVSPADTLGVSNKTGIEINYINPVFCSTEDPNTAEVSFRRVIRVDANAVHGGVSYKREISFNTTSTACFNIGSDIKMLSYKDDDTEENLIFNVAFGHPDCAAKNRLTSFLTGKYNLDRSTMCNYVINDNTVASDYITDSSSPTGYCVVLSGGKNIRYSRPHNSGDQRGWAGRIAGHNGTNILYGFDHLIEMSVYVNNPTSGSIQALYGFGHDGTNGGFLLLIEPTGRLRIHLDGQGFSSAVWFETSATFPAAQWVKVKFYYKSETRSFELYINDILQTSFATSNTPTTYTTLGNRISVGASGGGSFPLTGRIAYIKHKVGQIPNANSFKYNGWKKHEAEAITIPMVNRKYLQLTYDSEAGGNQFQSFRRRSTIAQIENKSLTTSYSILARYENLNLAQEGQEMSVQIEMNRQSINQNNSIQGIAVEFSPET